MKAATIDANEIIKRVSSSLHLSIRALPGSMRPVFSAAYLLCRAADAIAVTELIPRHRRIYWVEKFPSLLLNRRLREAELPALANETANIDESVAARGLLRSLPEIFIAADALSKEDHRLVYEVFCEVCAGLTTDLNTFGQDTATLKAFQTAAQLEKYCRRIGGGPGIFWTRAILQHTDIADKDNILVEQGRMLGETLQLINIMRATPSDLRRGRCYWPQEELDAAGLEPQDLFSIAAQPRLRRILRKCISETVQKMTVAEEYVSCLPEQQFRLRAAVIGPVYWGMDTLQEIWKSNTLLDPQFCAQTPASRIYFSIPKTSAVLASDIAFIKGFRLRKEILLSSLATKTD